jgi:hypothetical protein
MTRTTARRWIVPLGLAACQPALAQVSPISSQHAGLAPHNEQGRVTTPTSATELPAGGDPAPQSSCYANCDQSTTPPILNVNDFACFLNHFAAGDTYANCDHSTTPPVLNVLDFSCFLNAFAAGCVQ